MKTTHWISRVLTLSLSVAPFAAGAVAAAAPQYTVHVVEPAVTDHVVLPDGPLPPVCKAGDTMRLRACRGEYESASFVVTTTEALEKVRIEVGPVTGPGDSTDAWPQDAVDVRVVKPFVRELFGDGNFSPIPTLLVHDETWLAIEAAPTEKDPHRLTNVIKGERRDAAELQPVAIENRKRFWITVRVPRGAGAGTYSTTVRITPRNAAVSQLTLNVEVYPFDLLDSMLEYSIYYPSLLVPGTKADYPQRLRHVNEEQYLADHRNMVAHGVNNPAISGGHSWNDDGTADWALLKKMLDLRESAGMRPRSLRMVSVPVEIHDRPLTPQERDGNRRYITSIRAVTKPRGYDELFFMAMDEAHGDRLSAQRDSMMSVHEAGAKVFVAVMFPTFFERVGDVLDKPVLLMGIEDPGEAAKKYEGAEALRHMDDFAATIDLDHLVSGRPEHRKAIDGMHAQGKKIFTYMNPTAGVPLPAFQRLYQGLAMWRIGYDGSMTWAYTHIQGDRVNQPMTFSMVYRTDDGVVDTLHWEGVREGVDDVRYLTTLYDALSRAAGRFASDPLIASTHAWLAELDVGGGDLDTIRHEMARRIIELQSHGHQTPEQLLKNVAIEKVRITKLPEAWRFKPDPDDVGVNQDWFKRGTDIKAWSPIRTDIDKGWESQGFAEAQIGHGWYRTALPLDKADLAANHKYLFFEAVDEEALIYFNGRRIGEHTHASTGLPISRLWRKPFSVALTGIQLAGRNDLAVRVSNSTGMGGVWKPVHLVVSAQELSVEQIKALATIRREQKRAGD